MTFWAKIKSKMFKSFIPFAHATSIYEIEIDFYKRHGVKTLFIDLDNTLDSYKASTPKQNALDYISALRENGITPIVVSNNKGRRVSSYANGLNVEFVNSARKPFPHKLNKVIESHGLSKDEVMLVGDQMMTDVLAAHFAKIRVVLTEKIVKEDQWTTHINRLMDRPIRRYHRKKGNLIDWRNK